MKINLTYRVLFSMLSATCLVILTLFFIMQWSIGRGFTQYLEKQGQAKLTQIIDELGQQYSKTQSWAFLHTKPPYWDLGEVNIRPEHEALRPPVGGPIREHDPLLPSLPPFNLHGPSGPLVVLNAQREVVLGHNPTNEDVKFRPVIADGAIVGYAGLLPPRHFQRQPQIQFLSQQKTALALAAGSMVLVVVLISLPLARRILKPVRAMAQATEDIAAGNYATRISRTSSDELGHLARAFNVMAQTLERHERDRRQWVADISHELRTPITILQGEIEAILDGMSAVSPDTVKSLHSEIIRLKRLVDDLYQLSLADSGGLIYQKEDLDLGILLRDVVRFFQPQFNAKNINVSVKVPDGSSVFVHADQERLHQLISNLLKNSLAYTDSGGRLEVSLATVDDNAIIEFKDTKPSVSDNDLDRLFERLYRAEGSRNRASGGSGLGLSISKTIVEAHEGTISAHHSPLGGLLIRITLPVAGKTA